MHDPLSGLNRGFCLYHNNSIPPRILDSWERTSLKAVFEVAIRMRGERATPRAHVIWVTSSHLVLALWSQACFLFSLLLCLANCSHHLALGFEKQAKSLPPGWHENIPAYTRPSCRSLSSQLHATSTESRAGESNGIRTNVTGQCGPFCQ